MSSQTYYDVTHRDPKTNEFAVTPIASTRPGQSIKIDIGKPLDKSITIDINHINVIDCIDQSIKIDTHNSFGSYCYGL